MPIKVSSNLVNSNSNYPLIRAEDNQISGLGYFASIVERINHPHSKRSNSFIAIISASGNNNLYQFIGDIGVSGQWEAAHYWQPIANYGNVIELFVKGIGKFLSSTHSVTFPNGIDGDFNQDGNVDINDFLEFLLNYGTSKDDDGDTNIGDGSKSPGGTPRTTNARITDRVGSSVSRVPFIGTYEYDNYDGTSDFQIPTSYAVQEAIDNKPADNISTDNMFLAEDRMVNLGGNNMTFSASSGAPLVKIYGATGYLEAKSRITVVGGTTVGGQLILNESLNTGTQEVVLKCPNSLATGYSLTFPSTIGTVHQVLETDGSGVLGWVDFPVNTNTYLGSTDQTLTAERKIILDGNNLIIENAAGTQVAKIYSTGFFQNVGRLMASGTTTLGAFLRLGEATDNGTNSITLNAPNSLSGSFGLTLPDADGTSGQALTTDGSGNLSFSTVSGGGGGVDTLLMTLGGRVQHFTSLDNRMMICGGTYGLSYYIWGNPAGITPSGGGTVDTSTFTLPASYQSYGAIRVPNTGQIRVDFLAKPLNSGSYSIPYVLHVWEFEPVVNSSVGPTCTMRGKVDMTSGSSSSQFVSATLTTTSDVAAGKYIFITIGLDAQTLSATAYQYMNVNITQLA